MLSSLTALPCKHDFSLIEFCLHPVPALMQLAEGQDAYQLLASPWKELWLNWMDEGNNAYKQQARDSSQQRLEFVQSLVAAALKNSSVTSQDKASADAQPEVESEGPQEEVCPIHLTQQDSAATLFLVLSDSVEAWLSMGG